VQRLNTARIKKVWRSNKFLLVDSSKSRAEGRARAEFNKKFNPCRFVDLS